MHVKFDQITKINIDMNEEMDPRRLHGRRTRCE